MHFTLIFFVDDSKGGGISVFITMYNMIEPLVFKSTNQTGYVSLNVAFYLTTINLFHSRNDACGSEFSR